MKTERRPLLLFFIGVLLLLADQAVEASFTKTPLSLDYSGETLYVGGSGPGNYSSIQAAIDDANDGDTIFVFDDASPYKEGLEVNKSLQLIGENTATTIIDAKDVFIDDGIIVDIRSDYVMFRCFTLRNSFKGIELYNAGHATIADINCYNIEHPLYLHISSDNIIENNYLEEGKNVVFDFTGIYLYKSNNNSVANNKVVVQKWDKFDAGIQAGSSYNNSFVNNQFFNCNFLAWEEAFAENYFEGNTNNGIPIVCLQDKSDLVIDTATQVALIDCSNILVRNIRFANNHVNVIVYNSQHCEVSQCTFSDSCIGVRLVASQETILTDNLFQNGLPRVLRVDDMSMGIWMEDSMGNTISHNEFSKNGIGLHSEGSSNNLITYNKFVRNHALCKVPFFGWSGGINLENSNDNRISYNTFCANCPHAFFRYCENMWTQNFWGRPHVFPKPVFGLKYGGWMEPPKLTVQFDTKPALHPW
jgi:parallel beta-helix repeat protein